MSYASDALIDALTRENKQLCDENAKLCMRVASLESASEGMHLIREMDVAENAKLRELCADMYGFIKRMDEDCGDVTFSDCFDYCKHDTADDGCCKTGECWYEQRLRELGIEVEG